MFPSIKFKQWKYQEGGKIYIITLNNSTADTCEQTDSVGGSNAIHGEFFSTSGWPKILYH